MAEQHALWHSADFMSLPTGIRGMVFNHAVYHNNTEQAVAKLQEFLGMQEVSGEINQKTCKLAEDMLELKGSVDTMNEFSDYLLQGAVNGARYCAAQFKLDLNGTTDPRQYAPIITSFNKDNYGEKIDGRDSDSGKQRASA